jgi:hypothetical protein
MLLSINAEFPFKFAFNCVIFSEKKSVGQSVLKLVRFSSGSCGSWVGNFRFGLGLHSDKSFGKTTHKVLIKEV